VGGGIGGEGDRGWDDLSPLTRCSPHVPKESTNHTILAYFGRWAVGRGVYCVLSLKAIELDRNCFGKLLGEIEPEFVRNLKGHVDFELRT
jgi:hypothetical protein